MDEKTRSQEDDSERKHVILGFVHWVIVPILVLVISLSVYAVFTDGDKLNDDLNQIMNALSINQANSPNHSQVSSNYKLAVSKGQTYVNTLHLSEEGLRDKLRGEPDYFSPDAAQYAIEHVKADYQANALFRAKEYYIQQNLPPNAIEAKLTGIVDKFTPAEADYAIKHLSD
jgi:hypothetical protein